MKTAENSPEIYADTARRLHRELDRIEDQLGPILGPVREQAVFTLNREGRALTWHEGVATVLGYSHAEFIGLPLAHLFAATEAGEALAKQELAVATERGAAGDDGWMVRKDGTRFWASGSITALRGADGALLGFTKIVRDATAARQVQDRATAADRRRTASVISGGIAHEINNMMTVVIGLTDLIAQDGERLSLGTDVAADIRSAAQRTSALAHQLLSFSGGASLRLAPCNLHQTIRDALPALEWLFGDGVQVVPDLGDFPGWVLADRAQVEEALLHLAVNANEAMPQGGQLLLRTVQAEVDERQARASAEPMEPGRYVGLVVADTGVGMDVETLARAFEPFFTTKPAGSSSGMGLAAIEGMVHQSQGYVHVESEPGRGSTFSLFFPSSPTGFITHGEVEPQTGLVHQAVLLVEDEPLLLRIGHLILERAGFEVLRARDGVEALAAVADRPGEIGLVVTDVRMPRMDGLELAKRLAVALPDLPVLFVSGYLADAEEQLPPGADFLAKPYAPATLVERVTAALQRGRSKSPAAGRAPVPPP